MSDLFKSADLEQDLGRPLADQLRPKSLTAIVGQDHLLKGSGSVQQMVESNHLSSMVLWGPPGVGKTTMARLIVEATGAPFHFEQLSAVFSGVADLRKIFDAAKARRSTGVQTVLFVDEIHRFNRAQQDGFLPHLESGLVTLIGATTENPSFELNPALLSRVHVIVLKRLDGQALEVLLQRAENHYDRPLPVNDEARDLLISMADGDGRFLLSLVETLYNYTKNTDIDLDREALATLVQKRAPLYDKGQESHYNLASALQKSIRGSDVDAALYWAARMVTGGEDPRFILRRLIVTASEDIGNADPQALPLAIAARDAYEFLGQPEGEIAIGQLVAYLASAPKSNRSYAAFKKAKASARKSGSLMPPAHAMNAPTQMMKDQGYGAGYEYDHDHEDGFSGLNYFPPELDREQFYIPRETGHEREIAKRLAWWRGLRERREE